MFYDLNDNPSAGGAVQMNSGGTLVFFQKVDAFPGMVLSCPAVGNLTVEARVAPETAWINLETGNLDLSPFAGTRPAIEFRITADEIETIETETLALSVS